MDISADQMSCEVKARLEATIPDIEAAMEIANAPSVSLGVIHEGRVLFRKSIGLRDVDAKLEATSNTSYLLSACSEVITSAALGILLAEGKISLDDPIRKHLPGFNPVGDPRIGEEATIADACIHSTGLPSVLFQGPGGAFIHRAEDHVAMVNALPTSDHDGQRFGEFWVYSSSAFGLLALIIETVSGMKYSDFLRQRVFAPLGLTQTLVSEADVEINDNIAHPYVRLTDGHWSKVNNELTTENHSPLLASLGIRSSVNDMLSFLTAVMNRFDVEEGLDNPQPLLNEKASNPLPEISSLWNRWWSHPVDDEFKNETAHTLGWYRTTIPTSRLGYGSYNTFDANGGNKNDTLPENILGRESEPRTSYGHYGITNGSVATTYCFPSSHTAIIVLANAAEAGDASDTISKILLQAVFDLKPRVDLLPLLREQRKRCLKAHDKVIGDWEHSRDPSRYTSFAQDFIGSYIGLDTCRISITASDTAEAKVAVIFNDNDSTKCDLEPYNDYSLSYMVTEHDKLLAKSMGDWDHSKAGVFDFVRENDVVKGFWWKWHIDEYPSLWVKIGEGVDQKDIEQTLETFGRFRTVEV
ncbi:hypothetical protein N7541_006304 [Penicillium brevicompactum]|uniref:Beta-lactamase-related domain-containing protein n=1 Tax=Penicillium brevicompactum TaxID=5074 RepID=A0A9W9USE1_PENBR|nr:hypothetical protein N7541_006304 [Penicillium brevicompactum]